jgi:hypothetical protein
LIWEAPTANAKSAMNESLVSFERKETVIP